MERFSCFPSSGLFLSAYPSGCGWGAVTVVQSYLIADAVSCEEKTSGARPNGVFFSGQSILEKASSGVSSVISGIVFAAAGFSGEGVKKVNELLYNGASFKLDETFAKYRFTIFLLMTLIPAISYAVSVLPYIMKRKSEYEKTPENNVEL